MNRIFKVVFSQVLGRHVVVSELASSIQRGACKAVVVGVLAAAAGSAWAASTATADSSGDGTISTVTSDAAGGTAWGSVARGWAESSGVIRVQAHGDGSSAMGYANGGTIEVGDTAYGGIAKGAATTGALSE